MAQFANLPDDCYLLIFVRLSSSTLISCRRVSRAWLRNQQLVFRQRKVLILLQGDSPVQLLTKSYYQAKFIPHGIDQTGQPMDYDRFLQHNQVKLCSFDQNVTRFLAVTFPHLSTLIVAHDDISSQNVNKSLIDLLQLYSSQVVTIKLYFNYRGESSDVIRSNIRKVIRTLNLMTALEHVTLESPNSNLFGIMCYRNMQFLTRINQFYYFSQFDLSSNWIDVLRQLEQTDSLSQLEHIAIGHYPWTQPFNHWRPMLHDWPLANRYTHFPDCMSQLNLNNLPRFAQSIGQFRSLTTFTINGYCCQFLSSLLTALSRHCPSLVHISIFIAKNLFVQPFDPSTVKPVESVKALDLEFVRRYHPSIKIDLPAQVHPLVHSFPNLTSIKITSHIEQPNRDAEFSIFFCQLKTSLGRESLRTDYSILD